MNRRKLVVAAGAAALLQPSRARGQTQLTHRIGLLGNEDTPPWEGLRQGLRDLGYVEGRNVTTEWRWSGGRPDRFPALAAELVDRKVDIIVASATQASVAAKRATATIPVVMAHASPEKIGLVDSLARPGGNVTGLSNFSPQLMSKRLELLKEIAPSIERVAALVDLGNPAGQAALQEMLAATAAVGIKVEPFEVRNPDQLPAAFASVAADRPHAIYAWGTAANFTGRKLIVEFAAAQRLPAIYDERLFVRTGGLMSYGPSYFDLFRRAAAYVDKILKGAKPADLPVEQPTTFDLFINLKTARSLGLDIPPAILAQADEVIE